MINQKLAVSQSGFEQIQYNSYFVNSTHHATINLTKLAANTLRKDSNGVEAPYPNISNPKDRENLEHLKQEQASRKPVSTIGIKPRQTGASPLLSGQFTANIFDGSVPNDNGLAIGNNGVIISVANTNLTIHDSTGADLLPGGLIQFSLFFKDLNIKGSKYDPRVLYDPTFDRFIVCCLNGTADTQTHILFAFSKTNNPLGEWNLYSVPGNPLNDGTWSDFPSLALTSNEIICTVNAIKTGVSWQLGFTQSYLWQINKQDGYNGKASLQTRLNKDIKYNGKNIRNLCPVQEGMMPTGKGCFLVSNRNFDKSNDTFFLLKLSGDLSSNPTIGMKVIKSSSSTYGFPPNALQKKKLLNAKNTYLATNDSRPLQAILQNGKIHLVGNTIDFTRSRPSIYHNIISDPDGNTGILGNTLRFDGYDAGFPSLAFCGKYANEDDMMINVNLSSDTSFPTCAALYYKNNIYSKHVQIFNSAYSIAVINDSVQRWGDYSGIQRRYNRPGQVWMSGTVSFQTQLRTNAYATRVSQFYSPNYNLAGIADTKLKGIQVNVYPNPVVSGGLLSLDIPINMEIDGYAITIYALDGKEVYQQNFDYRNGQKIQFAIPKLNLGLYLVNITTTQGTYIGKFAVNKD
ncbi:MAG: T9SS type A sorting domain-containing protein [Bacteroidota bacterium]|nr:T9SS type A sorting domain-containing protein [Bacteroidota bacterium]